MKANLQSVYLANVPARSFREHLRADLGRRCKANPQYSLRAFALDPALDHSTLSQIIRGKRRLADTMIEKLGHRLSPPKAAVAVYTARMKVLSNPMDEDTMLIEVRQPCAIRFGRYQRLVPLRDSRTHAAREPSTRRPRNRRQRS